MQSEGFSNASTNAQQARKAATRTGISAEDKHAFKIPCNVAICGTKLSPMYPLSCAKIFNALSFNLSPPSLTAPNINGNNSFQRSSRSINPAATSQIKSHTFRVIFTSLSSFSAFNNSLLTTSCVFCAKAANKAPLSAVNTRRASTAAVSRARVSPPLNLSTRTSCIASPLPSAFALSNTRSHCSRCSLSALDKPESRCVKASIEFGFNIAAKSMAEK
mmetsp:Transcript_476/g.1944  ORF Transcript_476/g.1944 Transcript_476/m.1944 type:complete len:218 (-) Transcript_476:113-766(-)